EVDRLVRLKQFGDARLHVLAAWPRGAALRRQVVDSWRESVVARLEAGDYEGAERAAKDLLKVEPDHPKAEALLQEARRKGAVKAIEALIARGDEASFKEAATRLKAAGQVLGAEQPRLLGKLETTWLRHVEARGNAAEKLNGYDTLLASIKSEKAGQRRAALRGRMTNAQVVAQAFQLKSLAPGEFQACRATLEELKKAADAGLGKRIDELLGLLELARRGADSPLGKDVEAFAERIAGGNFSPEG